MLQYVNICDTYQYIDNVLSHGISVTFTVPIYINLDLIPLKFTVIPRYIEYRGVGHTSSFI